MFDSWYRARRVVCQHAPRTLAFFVDYLTLVPPCGCAGSASYIANRPAPICRRLVAAVMIPYFSGGVGEDHNAIRGGGSFFLLSVICSSYHVL